MSKNANNHGSETMKKYITFYLNDEIYGLDVMKTESIERMTTITRVPKCEEFVSGVINLRGDIIPIVDLRKKMGFEKKAYDKNTRIIITNHQDSMVGLIVDKVREVLNVPVDKIYTSDDILKNQRIEAIFGVIDMDDIIVPLLSIEKLLGYE